MHPYELLQDDKSVFYYLVHSLDVDERKKLIEIAAKNYEALKNNHSFSESESLNLTTIGAKLETQKPLSETTSLNKY